MEIDIEKGKPMVLEASYETWLKFDVSELDIDWSQVKSIYCKYTNLEILMENGDIHELESYGDGQTDYKWPTNMKLFDADYNKLWEEQK